DPNAMQSLRGTYNGPVDPIETFFYIGAIASLLLLVGLCGAWRNRSQRRHLLFFGVTACVGIAYLLGGHTPFYEALYRWVPGVNLFRRPSDSAYLLNLGLAMAVGFAASHVDMANRRKIIPILMGATAWLAISCITMRGEDKNWQVATVIAPLSAAAVAFWGFSPLKLL
ncbi:MAG: hypothetical protein RMZ43_036085, partial [Nostoc sp. CmiVER01]|uniref:hypothetical protein n=1 Tax=Nostoc sp. CmiVER01 TaxID=3075384 RepID=UPI003D160426